MECEGKESQRNHVRVLHVHPPAAAFRGGEHLSHQNHACAPRQCRQCRGKWWEDTCQPGSRAGTRVHLLLCKCTPRNQGDPRKRGRPVLGFQWSGSKQRGRLTGVRLTTSADFWLVETLMGKQRESSGGAQRPACPVGKPAQEMSTAAFIEDATVSSSGNSEVSPKIHQESLTCPVNIIHALCQKPQSPHLNQAKNHQELLTLRN